MAAAVETLGGTPLPACLPQGKWGACPKAVGSPGQRPQGVRVGLANHVPLAQTFSAADSLALCTSAHFLVQQPVRRVRRAGLSSRLAPAQDWHWVPRKDLWLASEPGQEGTSSKVESGAELLGKPAAAYPSPSPGRQCGTASSCAQLAKGEATGAAAGTASLAVQLEPVAGTLLARPVL